MFGSLEDTIYKIYRSDFEFMFPALVWKPLIRTNSLFYISYVFLFPYFRNNPNRIVSRLRCITIILIQWVVSLGRDPSETVMKSSYRAQSRSKYKDGSRLRGVVLPCGFLLRSLYTQRIIWPFHFSLSLLFSVFFFLSFFFPPRARSGLTPRHALLPQ